MLYSQAVVWTHSGDSVDTAGLGGYKQCGSLTLPDSITAVAFAPINAGTR